jgi:peptidoglycan/xylan/chitin deacetylase (PgdA/CDA1 family)
MIAQMRHGFKRLAEHGLDRAGLASLLRYRRREESLVLAFHNVIGQDEPQGGDRALHLPLADFEAFLDELVQTHDVVPVAALGAPHPGHGRPRAAITFDDAYRGAVVHGVPALVARGLPATIFVAPGILGAAACWWDLLAEDATGLDLVTKATALDELQGDQQRILASPLGATRPGRAYAIATEDELKRAEYPGLTIAPHGWSHRNLARLETDILRQELHETLAWLRARFADVQPWIAYPYGSYSREVEYEARRAGYRRGFWADYGWMPPQVEDRFDLLRFTVGAGSSVLGFRLRCAGLPPR